MKGAAEGMGKRAVNDAADGTYEGTKKEAKDAVGKGQPPADKGKADPGSRPAVVRRRSGLGGRQT